MGFSFSIDSAANTLPIERMKTSPRQSSKPQQWPYIRWSEAEKKWKVDARTKDGGSRRFFETKTEAETFAQQCRIARENSGTSMFGNAELAKYGKTVAHAIDFYLKHLRAQESSVTIEAALKELLELRKAAGRNAEYLRGMSIRLGRFARDNSGALIASIDATKLDNWLAALPHAPATRNTFRRDLVTLFSFCEKRGYCEGNPAMKTDLVSDIDKPAGILTPAQAAALLGATDDSTLPYCAIGLFAGLRRSELQKLDWSEVDLDGGHIEVTSAKAKTKKRRLIPISENLAAWIRPLAKTAGPVTPPGLRKRLEAVRARAGLKEWPQNALRHSFGSYRLAEIADAARVSLEMGNSQAMVFAHYRELVKPAAASAFWKLAPVKSGKIVGMNAA